MAIQQDVELYNVSQLFFSCVIGFVYTGSFSTVHLGVGLHSLFSLLGFLWRVVDSLRKMGPRLWDSAS